MTNNEFTRLLADANEQLNQLSKIVKDNSEAQKLMLDIFFHPLSKQSPRKKNRVKIKKFRSPGY